MKRILAVAGMVAALCGGPLAGAAMAQETAQPPAEPAAEAPVDPVTAADPNAQLPVDGAAVNDPAPAPQWVGPEVKLETTLGDIIVVLDMEGAPKTARQFMGLVKGKHYDGAVFYRIETGFVIQFGDLNSKLEYRKPKLGTIPLETENNRHTRGALAMARGEATDSGQSTVYFDLSDNTGLGADPDAPPNTTGYAVFGHIVQGLDVMDAIAGVELAATDPKQPFPGKLPKTPVVIRKATVVKE